MDLISLVEMCGCNCGEQPALESAFTYVFGASPDLAEDCLQVVQK